MDKSTILQLESLRESLHTSLERLRNNRFETGNLQEITSETIINEINTLRKRFDEIEKALKENNK